MLFKTTLLEYKRPLLGLRSYATVAEKNYPVVWLSYKDTEAFNIGCGSGWYDASKVLAYAILLHSQMRKPNGNYEDFSFNSLVEWVINPATAAVNKSIKTENSLLFKLCLCNGRNGTLKYNDREMISGHLYLSSNEIRIYDNNLNVLFRDCSYICHYIQDGTVTFES